MYIIYEGVASKYKFLGVEEGEDTCGFCHKRHITKMFVVQNLDTGDVERFGSTCVMKALGLTSSDISKVKKQLFKEVQKKQEEKRSDFYDSVKQKRADYVKSGKDSKLPWFYSPEFKDTEKDRMAMEKSFLDELKLYR